MRQLKKSFESSIFKLTHTYALSFYSSQNVLGWSKFFVPDQKFIYILCQLDALVPVTNILRQNKRWFAFSKIGFCACTRDFEEALNAVKVKFLGWLKKFGPAKNIFGPVKGQGIRFLNMFQQFSNNIFHIFDQQIFTL